MPIIEAPMNPYLRQFQLRIEAKGGKLANDIIEWKGNNFTYHVICKNGHDCYPLPNNVSRYGFCKICAGNDPVTAEKNFRECVFALGGNLVYERWLGNKKRHHVICKAGHDCYPLPTNVLRGHGFCRTCAGIDPVIAEKNFRVRVIELGGIPVYNKWMGARKPHHVICINGHNAYPWPLSIQQGHGICNKCAGKIWDVFYIVVDRGEACVKFGVTSGDPMGRLKDHLLNGFCYVAGVWTGLDPKIGHEIETDLRRILTSKGYQPVSGREYFEFACAELIYDHVYKFLGEPTWQPPSH
jgi:hypothetical protein